MSEKIALGVLKGSSQLAGEGLFDSRLFNQSSGMDAGFGAEDDYNTYTRPLFAASEVASSIYRPKASDADVYGDADAQVSGEGGLYGCLWDNVCVACVVG